MKLFPVDEGKQDVLSLDINLRVTKSTRITSGLGVGEMQMTNYIVEKNILISINKNSPH